MKSSTSSVSIRDLLPDLVSPEGQKAANAALAICGETGVDSLSINRSDVLLLQVLVDDSKSMASEGRKADAITALGRMLTELQQTNAAFPHRMYISLSLLNKGMLHGFVPVEQVIGLCANNYECDGCTPMLGAVKHSLGTIVKGGLELVDQGVSVQTCTVIISDGEFNDEIGSSAPAGPFGYQDPKEISSLIRGITANKDNTVYGVAIGEGAKEAFQVMGIKENYILDPVNENFSFDAALKRISRAISTASSTGRRLSDAWNQLAHNQYEM